MRLFSPAKINLSLSICGKRLDGYHELMTLMQAVDLGDWISITPAEEDSMEVEGLSLSTCRDNLIWKAIDLFREKTGFSLSVRVRLKKRIPMAAGLGGGSGNGATALWAMNQLTGSPATLDELQLWSGEIGADLPFFFSSGTALCTGTGTQVESLAPLPRREVWLVKPPESLSTAAVYRALDLQSLEAPPLPCKIIDRFRGGELPLRNDLQAAAYSLEPRLAQLHDELVGAGPILLAGSGSTLICFGGSPPKGVGEQFLVRYLSRPEGGWYGP